MIWIVCVFALFLTGCQQSPQESHYTEVTVENPQAKTINSAPSMDSSADPHAGMDMASMSLPGGGGATDDAYAWSLPDGWKQEAGKGMRLASFHLIADEKAIDCSVVSLAGMAGGLEPNLKRWMGQIGLETSSQDFDALVKAASALKIKSGQEGKVFDFTTIQSKAKLTDKSMIVIMLSVNDSTLFVKMTGTLETIKKNKEDFFKLAQSIEPKVSSDVASTIAEGPADMKDPHAGMDMASMGSIVQSAAPTAKILSWDVPQGWFEAPASHMRLATFHLASDPKLIDCSVISLGGPAGGVEANLERWAGQLGVTFSQEVLKQLNDSSVTLKSKDGLEIKVYDFALVQVSSKETDKSMVAAILPLDQSTIFIKMTGELDVIKQNKDSFIKLLSSISKK